MRTGEKEHIKHTLTTTAHSNSSLRSAPRIRVIRGGVSIQNIVSDDRLSRREKLKLEKVMKKAVTSIASKAKPVSKTKTVSRKSSSSPKCTPKKGSTPKGKKSKFQTPPRR